MGLRVSSLEIWKMLAGEQCAGRETSCYADCETVGLPPSSRWSSAGSRRSCSGSSSRHWRTAECRGRARWAGHPSQCTRGAPACAGQRSCGWCRPWWVVGIEAMMRRGEKRKGKKRGRREKEKTKTIGRIGRIGIGRAAVKMREKKKVGLQASWRSCLPLAEEGLVCWRGRGRWRRPAGLLLLGNCGCGYGCCCWRPAQGKGKEPAPGPRRGVRRRPD